MAINRVDVQGTFIRQDASQIRQEADNRAYADMTRLAALADERAEENHITVTQAEAYEAGEERFDASEEGKNKDLYNSRQRKGKKKKAEAELLPDPDGILIGPGGKILSGGKRAAFDLKI